MRSKYERKVAAYLKSIKVKFKYEAESWEYEDKLRKNRISCADCGSSDIVQLRTYTPDFFLSNGTVIESKGRFTANDRRIALCFPEVKLLFMTDNKLSKRSTTRYTDWCAQKGIDCHVSYKGHIPERWV